MNAPVSPQGLGNVTTLEPRLTPRLVPRMPVAAHSPVHSSLVLLLRSQHRDHLTAARFWHRPAIAAYAVYHDANARDEHMAKAATIRSALEDAGAGDEAAVMATAECAAKAFFAAGA